jgi:two-component system sensor histidine kinase BaeS
MSEPAPGELATLPPPGAQPAAPPPPRPAVSLRRRLLVSLVGVSMGSVLVAGLITVVFARRADRVTAIAEMRRSLAAVADAERDGEQLPPLRRLERFLRFQGIGLVVITDQRRIATIATGPLGRRFPGLPFDRRNTDLDAAREAADNELIRLPAGLSESDLDVEALHSGRVDTGRVGSLVFVAQPLARKNSGVPVLVATRRAPSFGRLSGVLLGAGLVAALVAAGLSLWLVRRLTRPLQAMERTTRAIAGGDLGARVGGLAEADDELARLGAAIDSMAAELERAAGLERAFLMSVSHDLRTPLTSIRGYAEAVAEGATDDDDSRRRAATIIGSEARRLERLVADLLDLARLDAREFSLHPRPVDAAQVVAGAVEALQPAAAEAGLRLTALPGMSGTPRAPGMSGTPRAPGMSGIPRAPGEAALPATLDPERLAQIVANLVENALKYAATTVEVDVAPTPEGLEILVIDDGPGVDPADLPHVFERLYTSRRQNIGGTPGPGPGRKVGTGLGLAIVAQLAEAMGGTVAAGRTPDGRTRFAVSVASRPGGSSSSRGGSSSSSSSASASSSSLRTTAPSS